MPKTSIEWCDFSWPVINGCLRASSGCENCYAARLAATRLRHTDRYKGLATYSEHGAHWSGESRLDVKELEKPLRMRKPQRIFVCEMGDLFYEGNTNEQIAAVFGVMAACPQHTFICLTKRSKRMREWFWWIRFHQGEGIPFGGAEFSRTHGITTQRIGQTANDYPTWNARSFAEPLVGYRLDIRADKTSPGSPAVPWPLPNLILGVSCEDQNAADERIPLLLQTAAAVRFVSCEPLLGPVDLSRWIERIDHCTRCDREHAPQEDDVCPSCEAEGALTATWGRDQAREYRDGVRYEGTLRDGPELHQVIVGGESGPGARPMDEDWVRSIRDQCQHNGVAFFYKQRLDSRGRKISLPLLDGQQWKEFPRVCAE